MSAKFWSRTGGMRFRDEFQRQVELCGVAAFLVAFWCGFIAGVISLASAVWP